MRNNIKGWIYFLLILTLFFSCKTQKNKPSNTTGVSGTELQYKTFNVPKATFTINQQQGSLKVNGNVRIRKDSILIISIQPFLGVEIARIAITNDGITAVDRFNKRFCRINFSFVKEQLGTDVNYNIFQALFTNSLFIFDNPKHVGPDAFTQVNIGELALLQINKKGVNQEFNVNEKKQVMAGRIFVDNQPYSISWNYMNFILLENGYSFPHSVKMTVSEGTGKQYQMDVAYNKVELNKDINFQFSIPAAYTEVTWDELIKMLQ